MAIDWLNCKRCGKRWLPRVEWLPALCPGCKSKYWNVDREEKRTPDGTGA